MTRAIEITFPESSGLRRVRNFAMELGQHLGGEKILPLDQADHAITIVIASTIQTSRRSLQLIDRVLEKHCMIAEATIRIFVSH
jgi:hypothetical protein